MVEEAKRGLEWRKEFNRGGTIIGVTRANQIINKTKLFYSEIFSYSPYIIFSVFQRFPLKISTYQNINKN